ncbi:MAG: rhomboid family intramembrane serine protease, partial [Myxococcota bacterium]|nr:rhomboid family intramembrane serine protease [Myxococcota bacterium]
MAGPIGPDQPGGPTSGAEPPAAAPPEVLPPEHRWAAYMLAVGFQRERATRILLALICTGHLATGLLMLNRGTLDLFGVLTANRSPRVLVQLGAMFAPALDAGELWRLIGCLFLHGDGMHLLFNGVALLGLGRLCEALYGPSRFTWLFLLSGAGGAALSWWGGNELSVGASGGIFGLMGAGIVFGWRHRRQLPERFGRVLRKQLLPWVVLNLAIGLLFPFIDNLGHVGGLVTGSCLALVLGNRVVPGLESPGWVRLAMGLGSVLLVT